ncbi:hypothetical protein V6R21_08075 [Limibacter armeniacum]|uniref:hypothetical protein n=1 Tax=Limibacter armeniacum TaxID=466084 RepID=UPI002FE643C0
MSSELSKYIVSMVLGVYWYYGFPEGLYSYDFFKFRKGLGGFADAPAELMTDISVENTHLLLSDIEKLVSTHKGAYIFVYKSGNHLRIGTGGYMINDFEFELLIKVEDILKNHGTQLISTEKRATDAELIKLSNPADNQALGISKPYLSIVSSSPKKWNAETSSIRFDCNLFSANKEGFLKDLLTITDEANINVVHYLEKRCGDQYNLMLFFTNGRQGRELTQKQKVDIHQFETGLEQLIERYNVLTGHISGFENYPTGKHITLKIIDSDFILG